MAVKWGSISLSLKEEAVWEQREKKILGATRKEEVADRSATQCAHYVLDVSTDHLS